MPRKPTLNHRQASEFLDRWGIAAHDLAAVENTSTSAIHMRVMNFGTPFQRRSKLTPWEKKYGMPIGAIADELGVHPMTVMNREKIYGTPYCDDQLAGQGGWNKGVQRATTHWSEQSRNNKAFVATKFTLEDALQRLKKLKR